MPAASALSPVTLPQPAANFDWPGQAEQNPKMVPAPDVLQPKFGRVVYYREGGGLLAELQ